MASATASATPNSSPQLSFISRCKHRLHHVHHQQRRGQQKPHHKSARTPTTCSGLATSGTPFVPSGNRQTGSHRLQPVVEGSILRTKRVVSRGRASLLWQILRGCKGHRSVEHLILQKGGRPFYRCGANPVQRTTLKNTNTPIFIAHQRFFACRGRRGRRLPRLLNGTRCGQITRIRQHGG